MKTKGKVTDVVISNGEVNGNEPEITIEIEKEIEFPISNVIKEEDKKGSKKEVKKDKINPNEIITPGNKGVTNAQMIPAIKKYILEGSTEKVNFLKNNYPEVFESSMKYISTKYKDKLQELK